MADSHDQLAACVLSDVLAAKRAHRCAQDLRRLGHPVEAKFAFDMRDICLRLARKHKTALNATPRPKEPVMTYASKAVLARSFCRVLRSWLTADELREAVEKNRTETSPGICHSHDHCDANMAMERAFIENGVPVFTDGHITDEVQALWNDAWNIAMQAEFDPDKIKEQQS